MKKNILFIFIWFLGIPATSYANQSKSLLICINTAPLPQIKEAAKYALDYINLPTAKKSEFIMSQSGNRKILYFSNPADKKPNDIPIYDLYSIGLSQRPIFQTLCKEKDLEKAKTLIHNELMVLSRQVITRQQAFMRSNVCKIRRRTIKKLDVSKFTPNEKEYFNLEKWENLGSGGEPFLMLVHTLRLKNMVKDWVLAKYSTKYLLPQPNYKDSSYPAKSSASLISNIFPYPVRGTFIGFSLKPVISAMVATAATDIDSNKYKTFDQISQAAASKNLELFKKIFPSTSQGSSPDWAKLNPILVARLSLEKWNEIIFKEKLPVDSYIMYDLNDPNLLEARFGSLDPVNLLKQHNNMDTAFRSMEKGCKSFGLPLDFLEVK